MLTLETFTNNFADFAIRIDGSESHSTVKLGKHYIKLQKWLNDFPLFSNQRLNMC